MITTFNTSAAPGQGSGNAQQTTGGGGGWILPTIIIAAIGWAAWELAIKPQIKKSKEQNP